jgi:transcription initiation factor TFIIIB Brf1 subunit/transcription initiation factor TFIIB
MNLKYETNNMDNDLENLNDDELFDLLDDLNPEKETTDADEDTELICKNCNTADKLSEDTSGGIIVCIGCGEIVTANMFDASLETRTYGNKRSNTVARCGTITNHFLPQSSLGTSIGGNARSKIKLLHSWSVMPYKERSLNIVLKQIHAKCLAGGIVKCIEDDAKILYKNISESKHIYGKNKGKTVIIRGTNRRSLVASCIFFACKRKGVTRSPKEIAKLFELKYKDITKGYKIFLKLAKIKHLQHENKISNPEHFITRYCRQLHITDEFIKQAKQIAKNIQRLDIASTHTPFSVATSSILLMIKLNKINIDKKFLAKKFNVSDVTITKTYKKIEKYKEILINDDLTDILANRIEEERKLIKVPDKLKGIYNLHKKKEMEKEKEKEKELELDEEVLKKLDLESLLAEDESEEERDYYVDKFKIMEDDLDEYIAEIDSGLYERLSQTDKLYEELFYD